MDGTPEAKRARRRSDPVGVLLVLLCGLALWAQALALGDARDLNPFSMQPINDAAVYWEWAGRIAGGRLVGDEPFLSSPLYPYLAGLVRGLGGHLTDLYYVQVALYLATGLVLYRIARLRFVDPERPSRWRRIGIVAVALHFLLAEPAFTTGRVLNGTLQVFTVALLWERMLAPRRFAVGGAALLGLVLGMAVLANASMLVAVPLVVVWVANGGVRAGRGFAPAGATLAAAALAIAPATLHNWKASGELIPVSAQAGVTFFHGNAPGATGTYRPIEGVSSDRLRQNVDARELVRAETDGSWKATSRVYLARGLAWWRAEPLEALRVAGVKAWLFFTGRNYGDIYVPALEAESGFAPHAWQAPLPLAWILPAALLALFLVRREPGCTFPERLLAALPFGLVVAFWYSPRYRLPVEPVACVLAAYALLEVARVRTGSSRGTGRALACAAAFALGIATGPLNRALGVDRLDPLRPTYDVHLGRVLRDTARFAAAEQAFARAAAAGDLQGRVALGDLMVELGRRDEGVPVLREAVAAAPGDAYARKSLGIALARQDPAAALVELDAALVLAPGDWETHSARGNVLRELGEHDRAVASYRRALALRPDFVNAHYNLGVTLWNDLGDVEGAAQAFSAARSFDPIHRPSGTALLRLHDAEGAWRARVELLRELRALVPDDMGITSNLAWDLATVPDDALRDGAEALRLADELAAATSDDQLYVLDTRAAALAELGRFDEAILDGTRAAQLAAEIGLDDDAAAMRARVELYRTGRPYRRDASGEGGPAGPGDGGEGDDGEG